VQFGYVCPVPHSLSAVEPPEYVAPVDAVSLLNGVIDCAVPCFPVDVSAVAAAAMTYKPFTTPLVPTASTSTADVEVPLTAEVVVNEDPAAPETTVALVDVAVPVVGNDTLYEPGAR
jgi:hypothetical protein